jgi:hypothetical protein
MNKELAQIINPVLPPKIGSGGTDVGGTIIGGFVSAITGAILVIAALLAFLYLLMGGIQWITAGGDKNQLESARNKIIHAIMGLIIIASLWAVMSLVANWIGFNTFPQLPFPSIVDTMKQQ